LVRFQNFGGNASAGNLAAVRQQSATRGDELSNSE